MSKVKVKFIYGGEHTVAVNEARNGPINWNNHAEFNTITAKPSEIIVQPKQLAAVLQGPAVVDFEEKKPNAVHKKPSLNTYKSAETLPSAKSMPHQEPVKKKPVINIEDANEVEFSAIKPRQPSLAPEILDRPKVEPSIKAPAFKIPPKSGGRGSRKEYIKGDNVQRYFYNGIPEKEEDQFVGCFGCIRRKPKTYSVGKPS